MPMIAITTKSSISVKPRGCGAAGTWAVWLGFWGVGLSYISLLLTSQFQGLDG